MPVEISETSTRSELGIGMLDTKEDTWLSPHSPRTNISINISMIYQYWPEQKGRQDECICTYKNF